MKTLVERFEDKIFYSPDGCWYWTDHTNSRMGYGAIKIGTQNRYAHQVSWELYKGEIPDGIHVCHSCDNPLCVNPHHLWLGTNKQNAHDRDKKRRNVNHKGEKHGMAKLSNDQVLQIKNELKNGAQGRDIANRFGVLEQTVSYIKSGKQWRSIQ
jgi:hypothetical protein